VSYTYCQRSAASDGSGRVIDQPGDPHCDRPAKGCAQDVDVCFQSVAATHKALLSHSDEFSTKSVNDRLLRGPAGRLERCRRLLWVGSGSSSRALERSLCGIKLTFTWQSSVGPQQPISVAVPQRAISVAVLNRKPWRFRSGILCRLAARRRQMAIGRRYTEGMIGTLLRLLTIEATLPYCGYIDPLFVESRYDRHDHLQPRLQPGCQPG
jgi:hypothetical protein